jgi:hypothetical protein
MSATARSARTAPARRRPAAAPATARRRPILTEVPPAPAAVAGRGVFALVLLVLNTSLAQGAFELGALTKTQGALAVQEQHLLQQVALSESPDALQVRASALGMVPVAAPVFLRLSDGAVLGTPTAAVGVVRPRATTLAPVTAAAATTTQVPSGTTTPPTVAAAPAKAAAPKPVGDAAVADPAPQTDAAVADTTPTVHR